ncbi:hypothetical protein IL306_005324 [Fusarium sp. DS 682]|nr:hypothetical protein IL306_005324 [Fusarium sp. DS 682]
MSQVPNGLIVFGPDANCTLALCPVEWSTYKYRPSLAANITFIVLFAIAMGTHLVLGIKWKQWIKYFAPEVSRFRPELVWWIFIPADVICLVLQAAGGALSTVSQGSSQTGIDIALAGLSLQVVILVLFCALLGDYLWRYFRSGNVTAMSQRMRIFFGFLSAAVILILARCAFRCYELSKGYRNSDLITDQGLFIGLEGVLIVVAVFFLCISHPGPVFNDAMTTVSGSSASDAEK